MIQTLSLIAMLFALSTPAFAQHHEPVELDTEHDSAENDPSDPLQTIGLEQIIHQKHLLLHRVTPAIGKNIDRAFRHTKRLYRRSKDLLKDASSYESFKIHSHRYLPRLDFGPTSVNSNHEFKDPNISDREFGFCWGYATAVRYFTTLAFFDPSLPRDHDLSFYKRKIDQVMRGEATVIPGYANLRELTLDPELEFYFKLNAMEAWRSRAVRRTSIKIFKNSKNVMNPDQVESLLTDLETRIARGELPKIMFGAKVPGHLVLGMSADIHAVLAYGVQRLEGGGARILLWDINYYTETLAREPKFLEYDPARGFSYQPWLEYEMAPDQSGFDMNRPIKDSDLLGLVRLSPENDAENVQMLTSLKRFCANQDNAKYCVEKSPY